MAPPLRRGWAVQRWTLLLALLTTACVGFPLPPVFGPSKTAAPKRLVIAPPSRPLPTIAPPPAPVANAPRVQRPAGHLDPASLALLGAGTTLQVPDPRGLYDRAGADAPATVDDGVLVCVARLTRGGYDDDFFGGGADVYMVVRLGEGAERGTHQTSRRAYSFPVAHLEEGDLVRVRVLDQDMFRDDLIGQGSARWQGGALAISTDGAEVSCRVAHGDVVARPLERALRRVDGRLERLRGARPDVAAYDLGYPTQRAADVRSALSEVLAWAPAGSDAIQDRIARAAEVEEAWEDASRDAVDEAIADRPPPGETVPFARTGTVRSSGLLCGAEAARMRDELAAHLDPSAGCLLRVDITADRGGLLPASGDGALDVWGLDRTATMIPLQPIGLHHGEEWLDAVRRQEPLSYGRGDVITEVYAVPAGTRPALLRLGRGAHAVALRVE